MALECKPVYISPQILTSLLSKADITAVISLLPHSVCKPLPVPRLHSETGPKACVLSIHNSCPQSSGPVTHKRRIPSSPWHFREDASVCSMSITLFSLHRTFHHNPQSRIIPVIAHSLCKVIWYHSCANTLEEWISFSLAIGGVKFRNV